MDEAVVMHPESFGRKAKAKKRFVAEIMSDIVRSLEVQAGASEGLFDRRQRKAGRHILQHFADPLGRSEPPCSVDPIDRPFVVSDAFDAQPLLGRVQAEQNCCLRPLAPDRAFENAPAAIPFNREDNTMQPKGLLEIADADRLRENLRRVRWRPGKAGKTGEEYDGQAIAGICGKCCFHKTFKQ